MAQPTATPIIFVIAGQRGSGATRGAAAVTGVLPGGLRAGRIKESVRVGTNRDAGVARVGAMPGEDVVVLSIDGGPELILHPETARDLLRAQAGQPQRGASDLGVDEVAVAPMLRWPTSPPVGTATRSRLTNLVGGIVVKVVDIVTGVVRDEVAGLAAGVLARKVDAQVTPGVYQLDARALTPLKESGTPLTLIGPAPANGEMLVFVHGTFSNTASAFDKLWRENDKDVQAIFRRFQGAVYGLDHPTLGESPIANALLLAEALPPEAALHLVTHSRGGLVAEVLARICGQSRLEGSELAGFNPQQRDELNALAAVVKHKRIRVNRVVRVACPARGTLLASKRVDAYLSVFKWTLQLAGVPVLPELVDFLGAVAQNRFDPDTLPGLEAQVPDSPLIRWLHAGTTPIPGELRVVAGDVQGDSVTSWIKVLLSDSFYWTDNDFVVQTRSMYGGSRRQEGATFLLDQAGTVSHSAYFGKGRAAGRVVDAILKDDPSEFRVIGPLSWKGESSAGDRAAAAAVGTPGSRPVVFVVPGLAASSLKSGGDLIWPASLSVTALERLAYAEGSVLTPTGLVGDGFDDLIAELSATHLVITFPYDWRQPLDVEAKRLATAIDEAVSLGSLSGQPVRVLTHSSGALLARVVQLVRPDVWERWLSMDGAHFVMLGPPNDGFWTPMRVLSGDETFGGLLTAGAPPFGEADVRAAMGTFPGLLQLQAGLLDPAFPLGERTRWQQLADTDAAAEDARQSWHTLPLQRRTYRWGIPVPSSLEHAVALRAALDEQARTQLQPWASRISIVVGSAPLTPDGFDVGVGGLVYLDAPDAGDGQVTTARARLPGTSTWLLDCDHAALPRHQEAFPAYLELLQKGKTAKLAVVAAPSSVSRGRDSDPPSRAVPSRPARRIGSTVPERERDILSTLSTPAARAGRDANRALRVRVINGDLMFVRQPLLLGHYKSMKLTGTELVMDTLIGQRLTRGLQLGSYPEGVGTNQVFLNTQVSGDDAIRLPRPEAVVIVGLGEEGKLNASSLMRTVRQGVVAWAQRASEKPGAPALFDLAATLVASGGKGVPVSQSAQVIAEAVREANTMLDATGLPQVGELQLVELYLDRATEAWRALRLQAQAASELYAVAGTITAGNGALRRPLDSNYRGAAYDFISAVAHDGADGRRAIVYSLDTKRARTELTAQATQMPLLAELMSASNVPNAPSTIGQMLFSILVPGEIEPFLDGSTEMVIEVDSGTAGIPWELLDTHTAPGRQEKPWAVRSKLVRKLRMDEFRARPSDASADDRVLVIGEPQCDPARYLRLPGARREARAVVKAVCRTLDQSRVTAVVSPEDEDLPGPTSIDVLSALYQHPWRIVHIAGHGEPTTATSLGGVVLSPWGPKKIETFLSAIEIRAMRVVPELVFVNCCHIAARDRQQLLAADSPFRHHYDRPAFAAGLAEALIGIGVRCVIAAGWAVDDTAAKAFAETFYDALLDRRLRFMDAAAEAREAARHTGGNTWAAYQCYGDPEWTFAPHVSDAQQPTFETNWDRDLSGVAAPQSLMLVLDTIATKAKFHKQPGREEADRLNDLRAGITQLEERFGEMWGHLGHVAEMFGTAWAEVGDLPQAVVWYDRAVGANDGTASLRAVEQAGNLRTRLLWKGVSSLADAADLPPEKIELLRTAAADIETAIAPIVALNELRSTMERESLIASAYKRLALVWAAAGDAQAEAAAMQRMSDHYRRAETIGRDLRSADLFYPAGNRVSADIATYAGSATWTGLDAVAVEQYRQGLRHKLESDPDFWSAVGEIELAMFEALASSTLATVQDRLVFEFEALGQRVPAARMWRSVYDNTMFVFRPYVRRLEERASSGQASPTESQQADIRATAALLAVLRRLSGFL